MKMVEQSKSQLKKRRDEINRQLSRVNRDERIELERNMEDQAIQIEHNEVSVSMEANLRTELNDIEEKLAMMDNK